MDIRIKSGDIICHPTYGTGTVVSVGKYIEATFESAGPKMISKAWAVSNCSFLEKGAPSKENAPKSEEQLALEARVDTLLANFDSFRLSDLSYRELRNFLIFKASYWKKHRRELRYHLLLQCENDNEAALFISELEKAPSTLGALKTKTVTLTEQQLDDKIPEDFPLKCSMLAIRKCEGIAKDTVAIVSSSIRANLQLKKQRKDTLWRTVQKLSDLVPDCTVLAAGSKEFVDYLRQDDHLYYRFFAHRIILRPMTVEEVIQDTLSGIQREQLKTTLPFREELEKYIKKIYPSADLKDSSFVQDLLNRILVSYYTFENNGVISDRCIPFYRKPRSYEAISEQLNRLVGLDQVKKEFHNLYKLSADTFNKNKQRLHFAFVGNPGTGKTTVANLTAELLFSMGLIRRNKIVVVAPTDVVSIYKGKSGQLMQEKINEAQGGVLFIDEAYFLIPSSSESSSPQKQCLEVLLQEMEKHPDNLSVIFAGYEEEIQQLLKSNPGLDSRVPYRFKFEDYSTEELLQIFLNLAAKENMTLEKGAYGIMLERLALAKTEENFGNARTVANIYQQLKSRWADQEREERVITAEDIRATMPIPIHTNLDSMIGLESVKRELVKFESRIKYIKFLKEQDLSVPVPNMHMMFTGNPGTGKTTVAKKIADCLYHIGILKTNKLVVAERKDLVSEVIGGTAQKTNKMITKALNGVLFIDEAYSLYKGENTKDFGTEAIETLITAMEEHKDRLVVVFAGYQEEMGIFQKANPGISSRIGFTFHFPDYSPEELTQMFFMKMEQQKFSVAANAKEKVHKVMSYFSVMENFGNGRFVDRVIDMTISNRSFRNYSKQFNDITAEDIPEIRDIASISAAGQNLDIGDCRTSQQQRRIAVHEIGHALVSCVLYPQRKIVGISINANADSSGRTAFDRNYDGVTESNLKAMLAISFGGRNAERIVFQEHSTGCASDMAQAKALAQQMVNDLAVGEYGVTTPMDLLREADRTATATLEQYRDALLTLSDMLCQSGTLSGDAIRKMLPTPAAAV